MGDGIGIPFFDLIGGKDLHGLKLRKNTGRYQQKTLFLVMFVKEKSTEESARHHDTWIMASGPAIFHAMRSPAAAAIAVRRFSIQNRRGAS